MQLEPNNSNTPFNFENFSNEVILHIVQNCDVADIGKIATMNHRMKEIVDEAFKDIYKQVKHLGTLSIETDQTSVIQKVRQVYELVRVHGESTIGDKMTNEILNQKDLTFVDRLYEIDSQIQRYEQAANLIHFFTLITNYKGIATFPNQEDCEEFLNKLGLKYFKTDEFCETLHLDYHQLNGCDEFPQIIENGNLIKNWMNDHKDYFESVTWINMSHHSLKSIPAEIAFFTSLKTLDLPRNQLCTLPPEIGNLHSLQVLDLSGNSLATLPSEIQNLSSLKWLSLETNHLKTLPFEFEMLRSLETLMLNSNHFTEFPKEICSLSSLDTLELSNNQLTSLPSEISQLSLLRKLRLDGNQIAELPDEIGSLNNLNLLVVSNNKLKTFPAQITKLASLRGLDATQNPLLQGREEIEKLLPRLRVLQL